MVNVTKLPPFGKLLTDRQRFKNPPWLVVVCVGGDAWSSAKIRNKRNDSIALVLPPDKELAALTWPVKDCLIVVEWTQPAPEQLVIELIKVLLSAGAESVTVWPRWVDYSQPNLEWPAYHQSIRTYRIDMKGVAHAA